MRLLLKRKDGSPVSYRGVVFMPGVICEVDDGFLMLPHPLFEAADVVEKPSTIPTTPKPAPKSDDKAEKDALRERIRAAGGKVPRGNASVDKLFEAAVLAENIAKAAVKIDTSDYVEDEDA